MARAEDREIRRHVLRLLAGETNGRQNSRILFMQLIDLAYRITWREFDRTILYLSAGGFVEVQELAPEVSPVRTVTITKKGLDVYEGTVHEPGIMPPVPRQD
jgi:hypothetical protein